MGKAPYQSPKDHVELQPSVNPSSEGAASIHSKHGPARKLPQNIMSAFLWPWQSSRQENVVFLRFAPPWGQNLPMDLKPLIALLAIVNPIGAVPFFIHFTQALSPAERRRTIRVSSTAAFVVIAVSGVAGLQIIEFFGISIASFQVGGGLLLLVSSLNMLNAHPAESRPEDADQGRDKAESGASIAVVPLTIPLLTGPATISTMVIYAEKTRTLWEHAVLVGYGVVIALATFIAFSAAGRIAKVLGQTGINVMTRLMGLILAAMAVELLADGLVKLFPVLASHLAR
jgi:multiple antibiotic resistance protein